MTSREHDPLNTTAGVGLRAPHIAEVIADRPPVAWFEVHAENYMTGGPALAALEEVRRTYPLALHGVGLSLGGAGGIDRRHLRRLRALVDHIDPVLVSEHLAWSVHGGVYFNHLLPLPYTHEALAIVAANVTQAQDVLGRPLLIENPSSYLRFRDSTIPEGAFLAELARRTGCRLLCDVNNAYITSANLGLDPFVFFDALPPEAIGEFHLAGHSANDADTLLLLIDDHGSRVSDGVWHLYVEALRRFGPRPTLIEWDTDVPALETLIEEACHANALVDAIGEPHALTR